MIMEKFNLDLDELLETLREERKRGFVTGVICTLTAKIAYDHLREYRRLRNERTNKIA
jgi:hypothetical protein